MMATGGSLKSVPIDVLLGVWGIAATCIAGTLFLGWRRGRQRRRLLSCWAEVHGMTLPNSTSHNFAVRFYDLPCTHWHGSGAAVNVMEGLWRGRRVVAFDSSPYSAVIAISDIPLKLLEVRPEKWLDRTMDSISPQDVDFEWAQFSREFAVTTPDRQWASQVIDARMMEFIARSPRFIIQFGGNAVIALREHAFTPEEFMQAADVAVGILERIPEFVRRQQGTGQ